MPLCGTNTTAKPAARLVLGLLVIGLAGAPVCAEEDRDGSFRGAVASVGLTVGGAVLAYYNYNEAQDSYDRYGGSAFTRNTKRLRRDVRFHDTMTVVGGTLAGLGVIGFVVSF